MHLLLFVRLPTKLLKSEADFFFVCVNFRASVHSIHSLDSIIFCDDLHVIHHIKLVEFFLFSAALQTFKLGPHFMHCYVMIM